MRIRQFISTIFISLISLTASPGQIFTIPYSQNGDDHFFINGLTDFWNGPNTDSSKVRLWHDSVNLYFHFTIQDTSVTFVESENERDMARCDRAEIFISKDTLLSTYYGAEMAPNGLLLDYEAHHYRKSDYGWDFDSLTFGHNITQDGYEITGYISIGWLRKALLLQEDNTLIIGIFRGESHSLDPKDKMFWYSWVSPNSPRPDFHIPSAFTKVRLD